jgi:preprotein translocase subunit SecA
MVLLTTIDHLWKDHLLAMDHLREGIGLQSYGQKDPLIAYKKEGFRFFTLMMGQITGDSLRKLFSVQVHLEEPEAVAQDEFAAWEGSVVPTAPVASSDSEKAGMQYNIGPNGELIPVEAALQTPTAAPQASAPVANPAWNLENRQAPRNLQLSRGGLEGSPFMDGASASAPRSAGNLTDVDRAGRNDPCPCGSGKKYKKCHGA